MQLLDQFQAYILLHKKVSLNTYTAYKHDVNEFLEFILTKNKTIEDLTAQDFLEFFNNFKKIQLSSSAAMRKSSALKLFAKYLHEKLLIADFSESINIYSAGRVPSAFPILCNQEKIFQILQTYKDQKLSYKELRNYIILYLLYISKVGINQLVKLHTYDLNHENLSIAVTLQSKGITPKKRSIQLAPDFFNLIKEYILQTPYNSTYLFPVKLGNNIKPISRQAVWSLLRLILKQTKHVSLIESNEIMQLEPDLQKMYLKSHPRP